MLRTCEEYEAAEPLNSSISGQSSFSVKDCISKAKLSEKWKNTEQGEKKYEKSDLIPPPLPVSLEEIVNPTPLLLEGFPIPWSRVLRCPLPEVGVSHPVEEENIKAEMAEQSSPALLDCQWNKEGMNHITQRFARSMADLTAGGKYMNLLRHCCADVSDASSSWDSRARETPLPSLHRSGGDEKEMGKGLRTTEEKQPQHNSRMTCETKSTFTVEHAALSAKEFAHFSFQSDPFRGTETLLPSTVLPTKKRRIRPRSRAQREEDGGSEGGQTVISCHGQGCPTVWLDKKDEAQKEAVSTPYPLFSASFMGLPCVSSAHPKNGPSGSTTAHASHSSLTAAFLGTTKDTSVASPVSETQFSRVLCTVVNTPLSAAGGHVNASNRSPLMAPTENTVDAADHSSLAYLSTSLPLGEQKEHNAVDSTSWNAGNSVGLPSHSRLPSDEQKEPLLHSTVSHAAGSINAFPNSCSIREERSSDNTFQGKQEDTTSTGRAYGTVRPEEAMGALPVSLSLPVPPSTCSSSDAMEKGNIRETNGLESLLLFFFNTPPLSIPADQLWRVAHQMTVEHQRVVPSAAPNPFHDGETRTRFMSFLKELLSCTSESELVPMSREKTTETKTSTETRSRRPRYTDTRKRAFSTSRMRVEPIGTPQRTESAVSPKQQDENSLEKDYLRICRGFLATACMAHPSWMLSLGKHAPSTYSNAHPGSILQEDLLHASTTTTSRTFTGASKTTESHDLSCGCPSREAPFTAPQVCSSEVSEEVITDVITSVTVLLNLIVPWTFISASQEVCTKSAEVILSSLFHYDTATPRSCVPSASTMTSSDSTVHQTFFLHLLELLRSYIYLLTLVVCCPTFRLVSDINLQRLEEVAYRVLFVLPMRMEGKGKYPLYALYTSHSALNLYRAVWNHTEEQRHRLRQEFFSRLPAEEEVLLERTYEVGSGNAMGGVLPYYSPEMLHGGQGAVWLEEEKGYEKERKGFQPDGNSTAYDPLKSGQEPSCTRTMRESTNTAIKVMPFSIAVLSAAQSCPSLGFTSSIREKETLEQLSASQWLLLQCSQWFDTMVRELLCVRSTCVSPFCFSSVSASGRRERHSMTQAISVGEGGGGVGMTSTNRRWRQRLLHYFLEDVATLVGTLEFPSADIICRTAIAFLSKIIHSQCLDPVTSLSSFSSILFSSSLSFPRSSIGVASLERERGEKGKKEVSRGKAMKKEHKEEEEKSEEHEMEREGGMTKGNSDRHPCTFQEEEKKSGPCTMWEDPSLFPFAVDAIAGFLRILRHPTYPCFSGKDSTSVLSSPSEVEEELFLCSRRIFQKYTSLVSSSGGIISSPLWVSTMLTKNEPDMTAVALDSCGDGRTEGGDTTKSSRVKIEKQEEHDEDHPENEENPKGEEDGSEGTHRNAVTLIIRQLQGMLYRFLMKRMPVFPSLFQNARSSPDSQRFSSLLSVDKQSAYRHCVGAILAYWCWLEEIPSSFAPARLSSTLATRKMDAIKMKRYPMNWNAYQLQQLLQGNDNDPLYPNCSSASTLPLSFAAPASEVLFSAQLIHQINVLISAQRVKGVLHESVRRSLLSLLLTALHPRETNSSTPHSCRTVAPVKRPREIQTEVEKDEEEVKYMDSIEDGMDPVDELSSSLLEAHPNARTSTEVRLSSLQTEGVKKALKHLPNVVRDFPYCMEYIWNALRRYIQYGNVKLREASIPLLQTLFTVSVDGSVPQLRAPFCKTVTPSPSFLEIPCNALSSLLHLLDDSNEGVVLWTLHAWDSLLTNPLYSISLYRGGFGEHPIGFIESRLLLLLCGEHMEEVRTHCSGERGRSSRGWAYSHPNPAFPITTPYDGRITRIFVKRWTHTLREEQKFFSGESSANSSASAALVKEILTLMQFHVGSYPYDELSVFVPHHPLLRLLQLSWPSTVRESRLSLRKEEEEVEEEETKKSKGEGKEEEGGTNKGVYSPLIIGRRGKGSTEEVPSEMWQGILKGLATSLLEQYRSPACSKENAALSLAMLYLLSHVSIEIVTPMMDVLLSYYAYPPSPHAAIASSSSGSSGSVDNERSSINYVFIGLILREVLLSSREGQGSTLALSLDKVAMLATSLFSRYAGPQQQKVVEVSCGVLASLISHGSDGTFRSGNPSLPSSSSRASPYLFSDSMEGGYSEIYLRHCYSLMNGYFVHLHQLLPSLPENKANMGYAQRLLFLLSEMLRSYRGWCDVRVVNKSLLGNWMPRKVPLNPTSSYDDASGSVPPRMLVTSPGICSNVYELAEAFEKQLHPLNAYPSMHAMILRTFASLCMLDPNTFFYRCKSRILGALDVKYTQDVPAIRLQGLTILRDFLVDEEARVERANDIGQSRAWMKFASLSPSPKEVPTAWRSPCGNVIEVNKVMAPSSPVAKWKGRKGSSRIKNPVGPRKKSGESCCRTTQNKRLLSVEKQGGASSKGFFTEKKGIKKVIEKEFNSKDKEEEGEKVAAQGEVSHSFSVSSRLTGWAQEDQNSGMATWLMDTCVDAVLHLATHDPMIPIRQLCTTILISTARGGLIPPLRYAPALVLLVNDPSSPVIRRWARECLRTHGNEWDKEGIVSAIIQAALQTVDFYYNTQRGRDNFHLVTAAFYMENKSPLPRSAWKASFCELIQRKSFYPLFTTLIRSFYDEERLQAWCAAHPPQSWCIPRSFCVQEKKTEENSAILNLFSHLHPLTYLGHMTLAIVLLASELVSLSTSSSSFSWDMLHHLHAQCLQGLDLEGQSVLDSLPLFSSSSSSSGAKGKEAGGCQKSGHSLEVVSLKTAAAGEESITEDSASCRKDIPRHILCFKAFGIYFLSFIIKFTTRELDALSLFAPTQKNPWQSRLGRTSFTTIAGSNPMVGASQKHPNSSYFTRDWSIERWKAGWVDPICQAIENLYPLMEEFSASMTKTTAEMNDKNHATKVKQASQHSEKMNLHYANKDEALSFLGTHLRSALLCTEEWNPASMSTGVVRTKGRSSAEDREAASHHAPLKDMQKSLPCTKVISKREPKRSCTKINHRKRRRSSSSSSSSSTSETSSGKSDSDLEEEKKDSRPQSHRSTVRRKRK